MRLGVAAVGPSRQPDVPNDVAVHGGEQQQRLGPSGSRGALQSHRHPTSAPCRAVRRATTEERRRSRAGTAPEANRGQGSRHRMPGLDAPTGRAPRRGWWRAPAGGVVGRAGPSPQGALREPRQAGASRSGATPRSPRRTTPDRRRLGARVPSVDCRTPLGGGARASDPGIAPRTGAGPPAAPFTFAAGLIPRQMEDQAATPGDEDGSTAIVRQRTAPHHSEPVSAVTFRRVLGLSSVRLHYRRGRHGQGERLPLASRRVDRAHPTVELLSPRVAIRSPTASG